MKPRLPDKTNTAMTLTEVVVVIGGIGNILLID